jgi:hypothetical protein
MRDKRIALIPVYGLLLVLVGCPRQQPTRANVRSVAVDPELGAYSYAHPGDILEFIALNPNTADFYVIFDGQSPCAKQYYLVTKDRPATCEVRSRTDSYRYHVSSNPPFQYQGPAAAPRRCPWCQIILTPPISGPPGTPPPPPPPTGSKSVLIPSPSPADNVSVGVKCNSGTAGASPTDQSQGGGVFWNDADDPATELTITVPDNICSGKSVFKQYELCTLTGPPRKEPYTYSVQANGCQNSGNGSLTIDEP